jgi:AMMECR1 domain-containing protein
LLQKGGHSAVLLPQVIRDEGWTRQQLLDHLCEKAGLPPGCWTQGAMLATFQTQVFSDRRTR